MCLRLVLACASARCWQSRCQHLVAPSQQLRFAAVCGGQLHGLSETSNTLRSISQLPAAERTRLQTNSWPTVQPTVQPSPRMSHRGLRTAASWGGVQLSMGAEAAAGTAAVTFIPAFFPFLADGLRSFGAFVIACRASRPVLETTSVQNLNRRCLRTFRSVSPGALQFLARRKVVQASILTGRHTEMYTGGWSAMC